MKNTILHSLAFLSLTASLLTACGPRDVDVLSAEDKAFIQSKGRRDQQNDKNGGAGRARVPQKLELSLGAVLQSRQSQAIQVLAKAQSLLQKQESAAEEKENCLKAKLIENQKLVRHYNLYFFNCNLSSEKFETSMSGMAQLTLHLDDSEKLRILEYQNQPLDGKNMNVMTVQMAKKDAKDTLLIQDSTLLILTRNETQTGFVVQVAESQSHIRSGFEDSATLTVLSSSVTHGEIIDGKGKWSSHAMASAVNLNTPASLPSVVELSLDSAEEPQSYKYVLKFGKVSRSGLLVISGNEVTALSRNEKTKKEEKSSVQLKPLNTIEAISPWELWF